MESHNSIVPEIHFITSKKGNKLLVFKQYTYAKNFESKYGVSWTCSSLCSKKCQAQVTLSNVGKFQVLEGNHTHPPPVFYVNDDGRYLRLTERQLKNANDSKEDLVDGDYIEELID